MSRDSSPDEHSLGRTFRMPASQRWPARRPSRARLHPLPVLHLLPRNHASRSPRCPSTTCSSPAAPSVQTPTSNVSSSSSTPSTPTSSRMLLHPVLPFPARSPHRLRRRHRRRLPLPPPRSCPVYSRGAHPSPSALHHHQMSLRDCTSTETSGQARRCSWTYSIMPFLQTSFTNVASTFTPS